MFGQFYRIAVNGIEVMSFVTIITYNKTARITALIVYQTYVFGKFTWPLTFRAVFVLKRKIRQGIHVKHIIRIT